MQQVCEAMAAVVEIEITVLDRNLERIAGTGRHRDEIGHEIPPTAAFAQALATGIPVYIFNPLTDKACLQCSLQGVCSQAGLEL